MEPPLLLDLAIKALIDNIDKLDKDLVKTIIVPFRQKMLKEMLEMVRLNRRCNGQDDHNDKQWAILPFLINSKNYTKLDLLDLMVCDSCTVTNSRFQEFIRGLRLNTPNLRELIIYAPVLHDNEKFSLDERELNSIIQLKNLAFLKIYFVQVPLSGILDISRRCEKLEEIFVDIVILDVEFSYDAFGDDFANLHIDAYNIKHRQVSLMMKRKIGMGPKYKDNTQDVRLKLQPEKNQDLFLVQWFAEKLKEIEFDSSQMENIDEFPHLPQLKKAMIICNSKSVHVLRCFMKRNGESLQELSLCQVSIRDKIAFSEILNFCPNLQSLALHCCSLSANDAPFDAIQQLKQFSWCSKNIDYRDKFAFSSILSAPLLEDINIDLSKIDFSDNATIIGRIQKREILRNIKKINMVRRMNFIFEDEDDSSYWTSFTELENAFASVISAGPL
ncbi:Hypothetical predicted protein [Cloeon dipterum]|uniref:Uncharacterized protein n=1 Tax=Cloeon dipterum TaxID=197152 RepID=A0A8S1DF38_9INSE|nr:Hypothetical predicted protein [Cloeon dipterum]